MSIFEYLEAQAQEDNLPFRNAAVVAIDRVERRFASFVESARGEKEFNSRLDLIRDQIEKIASDVCEEFGYDDPAHIARLAIGQIEVLAARPEPEGRADATQKLKSQKPDGYYTEPSPKLNPGSAGDHVKNTNPPIPELEPDDRQNPTDYEWPWNSDIPMEGEGLKRVDVTKQKREQVGPNTQTFPDKGQADPVTAAMHGDTWAMEDNEDVDDEYFAPAKQYDVSIDNLSDLVNDDESEKDDELHLLQEKMESAKTAAERMDFNALSEIMTPSDAIGKLVEAGMPEHEAKDRIDFYVNHVDPGWAHKSWTSTVEKESLWDQSVPEFMEMSYDVESPTIENIRQVYQQYSNSPAFENPQHAVNTLFTMYAENANTPEQIQTIADMMDEAIGMKPSNMDEVMAYTMRFASGKTADYPGVYKDISQMQQGVLEREQENLTEEQADDLRKQIAEMEQQESEAAAEYFTPGMNIDPEEEDKIKSEMPERIDNPMEEKASPVSPTKDMPVKYKMTASYYENFLKKQKKN